MQVAWILTVICILQCIHAGMTFTFHNKNLEELPRYFTTPEDISSFDVDLPSRDVLLNLIKRNVLTDENSWQNLPYPGPSFHRMFGGRRFGVNTASQNSRGNLWRIRSSLPHAASNEVQKRTERRNSGLYVTDDESENGMFPDVNEVTVRKRMHTCPFFFRSGWPLGACYTPTFFQHPAAPPPLPTPPPTPKPSSLLRRHAYRQLKLRWPIMHMMGGGLGKRSIETPNDVAFWQSKVRRSADIAPNHPSEIQRGKRAAAMLDHKHKTKRNAQMVNEDENIGRNIRFSSNMENLTPVERVSVATRPMPKQESYVVASVGTELGLQPSTSLEASDSFLVADQGSKTNFKKSAWYRPNPTYYWPSMFMLGGGLGKRAGIVSTNADAFQSHQLWSILHKPLNMGSSLDDKSQSSDGRPIMHMFLDSPLLGNKKANEKSDNELSSKI